MAGKTLGHYQIIEKIGAGGMGEVYRAHDAVLGRDVAVKVLPEAFARDPERLTRFEQEARLLAALNHPNIAAIHGLEESDGVRFLVLELVPGETLAERLTKGALPVEEALSFCRQIAEALEAAHEKGIIHRDLKPGNVKVTPAGRVKVLDFGLAKAFGADAASGDVTKSPTASYGSSREGVILGTAGYMSPEQARGKPIDRRTDLWSFGCVLYELLTGRQAFSGETVSDALASVLTADPDWSRLPTGTPPAIRLLVRRCLQKDAARRLQHIGDARIEIEEFLAAPKEARAAVPTAAPRRRAGFWLAAGLIGGVLLAGTAGWLWKLAAPTGPAMRFSAITNFAGVEAHPSLSPDGHSVTFVSNRDGQYDIYVGLLTGGSLVRITNDPNLKTRPRWSPDGSQIAYARLNEAGIWDLWVVPALGGTPRRILTAATDPAWSADGKTLAYANLSTGSIWLCDSNGSNARALTQPEAPSAIGSFLMLVYRQPAFSRGGREVAFVRKTVGPYGELGVADLPSGRVRYLTNDGANALSPVWSPDDRFIYFSSSRGGTMNIWKIPALGGVPQQITAGQGDDAELDLSADGRRLVFSSFRENINIAEVRLDEPTAKPRWLTADAARGEFGPAYSPDGKKIAYFTNRKGAEKEIIWVMQSDGSNPVQLVEDESANIFPRWTRDGQGVVFCSFRPGVDLVVRGFDLVDPRPKAIPLVPWDFPVDTAPDGRLLYVGQDGRPHTFDAKTNQDRPLDVKGGVRFNFSPDGRRIAYLVPPRQLGDPAAGLWVYNFERPPQQVFRGWVAWYAWAGPDEVFVAEGKPDLKARLWRVPVERGAAVRTTTTLPTIYRYGQPFPLVQFDVHPDHRRLAVMAFDQLEADIGMIENVP